MPPIKATMQHTRPIRPNKDLRNTASQEIRQLELRKRSRIAKRKYVWDVSSSRYDFEAFCKEFKRENMAEALREEKKRIREAPDHEIDRARREHRLNMMGIFMGHGMDKAPNYQEDVPPHALYLNVNGAMQYVDLKYARVDGPVPPGMSTFLEQWYRTAITIRDERRWTYWTTELRKEIATRLESEQKGKKKNSSLPTFRSQPAELSPKTPPVDSIDSGIGQEGVLQEEHILARQRRHQCEREIAPDAVIRRGLQEWSWEKATKAKSAPPAATSRVDIALAEHRRRIREMTGETWDDNWSFDYGETGWQVSRKKLKVFEETPEREDVEDGLPFRPFSAPL
jgi:hypothetical protein